MRHWKSLVIGLVGALLGVMLISISRHLWQDHAALHELAVIELRRQQQGGGLK